MFHKKGIDITNPKECFKFLVSHSTQKCPVTFDTTIANKVDVFNIPFLGKSMTILAVLNTEEYFWLRDKIDAFELAHPGIKLEFDGRRGDYLLLLDKETKSNPIDAFVLNSPTYDDFKLSITNLFGSLNKYKAYLKSQVKLVQDFDKFCDDLVREYKLL